MPASYFGVGTHTVAFRVIDTDSNTVQATATFEVVAHQAPTVTITQPANNTQWIFRTLLNFSADVVNNDPVCPTNYTWIWRENNVQVWQTIQSFSNDNLSIGNHTITAYAVDDFNMTGSDQILIEIIEMPNALPNVTITSPINNATFINECQSIFFNATANDTDGTIDSYSWIWGSTVISSTSSFTLPASYFAISSSLTKVSIVPSS